MHQNVYIEKKSGLKYLKHISQNSKKAVFLMHGYGASMYDLYDLYSVIEMGESCDWYFPHGHLALGGQFGALAASWFPIDMVELERCMSQGIHRNFEDIYTPEFNDAVEILKTFVLEISEKYESISIGGFSQGAMLSSHLMNHVGTKLNSVFLFSGNLIGKKELLKSIDQNLSFNIFQSHGIQDPVLGFEGAEKLKNLLLDHNKKIKFESFKGGHEIPMQAINSLNSFLNN